MSLPEGQETYGLAVEEGVQGVRATVWPQVMLAVIRKRRKMNSRRSFPSMGLGGSSKAKR